MRVSRKKTGSKGFSLIELMVVVGIIAVLSALAMPRYQMFQARAKQSEARVNLNHIHTLQTVFHFDNNRYGTIAEIAFNVTGGTMGAAGTAGQYYQFDVTNNTAGAFDATATAPANTLASCQAVADVWAIDHDKVLVPGNGLNGC